MSGELDAALSTIHEGDADVDGRESVRETPAGPRPDGEEGTAAVEEPGPDRAAEDDAAGDEGAGEHNATDEGQAEGDGGGGEDERGPRGVSDEAEAAPGGEGEEVDGAAGGDGEGAEGVEGGAYEDDELATMKSGARDNITVMCVDGESRASGMYIVPADAVVWDAVLQFVEDQGMDPSGVVVRLRAEAVEVDKPFKLYGVSPGDALELVVYPRGLPPGTEVETEVEDEYRQMLEVEIPPGVDPATGAVVGHGRVVQVLVDWSMQERKKFLGGWRNKKSGLEYHNATAQTKREPKFTEEDRKLTRASQTVFTRTLRSQTYRECSTQCDRPNLDLNEEGDRVIIPYERGPYQTAEELWALKAEKTLVIQTHWRAYVARKEATVARENRDREMRRRRREAERRAAEEERQRQREIQRRVQPRTASDFELLRDELETWRQAQTINLSETIKDDRTRHGQLEELLYKETKLLQTIDRLQLVAQDVQRERRVDAQLRDMSAPKTWNLTNGDVVEVHTPFTIRARELMHLYQGLTLPKPTTPERLDVLLHVKYTVKEFDCSLTREIVQLIDREADLLNRGRSAKTLDGLRKRLANLFLAFIETPEFNPEAVRFTMRAAGAQAMTGPVTRTAAV